MIPTDPDVLNRISRLEAILASMRPDRSAYAGANGISITGASGNMVIDGAELIRRLELAESKIDSRIAALERLLYGNQPPGAVLTQTDGRPSWQQPASPSAPTMMRQLDRLIVRMSAQVDDDIRIRVGGITVYDPKQIVAPLREVSFSAAEIANKGAPTVTGTAVQIDTYDGQTSQYSLRKWTATAYYTNGTSQAFSGGSNFDGSSTTVPRYYANGSFTL